MARKKTKKTAKKDRLLEIRKNYGAWTGKHKIIFVLIVLFILLAGFWIKKQIDISNERKDFQAAERVVADLVNEIQKELGKTEVEEYKQCSYGTTKFEKKNLGCGFSYTLEYPVNGHEEAQALSLIAYQKITSSDSIIKTHGDQPRFEKIELSDRKIESSQEDIGFFIKNTSYLSCALSLNHYVSNGAKAKQGLQQTISCHSKDNVKTNYYPIKN